MYMTYVSGQSSLIVDGKPLTAFSTDDFRPTWLVRVSDMQRVPGTDATEGYCTISYSWNYSGDLIQGENGEYECIDKGKHKLIFKTKENASFFDHEIHEVKFEQLIQQLCKDFDIDYIWYDKMCIDQNDKVAKHTEIEQMHQIYKSAAYSVAMIPEMSIPESVESVSWTSGIMNISRVINNEKFHEREVIEKCLVDICQSQWMKRLWTLEEAIMSNHIVFVGRNAHLWNAARIFFGAGFMLSVSMGQVRDLFELFINEAPSANLTLRHAHSRDTAKQHDRAYALANIFAGLVNIHVDYDIPVIVALSNFYSDLIEKDLSVLCFGKSQYTYNSTLQDAYELPSWTGIEGVHLRAQTTFIIKNGQEISDIIKVDRQEDEENTDDDNDSDKVEESIPAHRLLINNVNYITAHPQQFPLEQEKLSRFTNDGGLDFTHYINELTKDIIPHEKMARERIDKTIAPGRDCPITFLSLTEDCEECTILDLPFTWDENSSTRIYPVIRKIDDEQDNEVLGSEEEQEQEYSEEEQEYSEEEQEYPEEEQEYSEEEQEYPEEEQEYSEEEQEYPEEEQEYSEEEQEYPEEEQEYSEKEDEYSDEEEGEEREQVGDEEETESIQYNEFTYKSIGILFVRCRNYYMHYQSSLADFTDDIQNDSFVIV
ncbi:heterokaryon incompatibility protein-domain-containing protein [Phascolomyces articulosus]|uniref:Heterokaryon incompatibility protein-domain-containing protein n=1 Tax=Phascolomyces articulosus TaxID=60185 RepID=A0AAD5JVB1_9FUNG|nr:heterokaryon incompatibility protein-domain-containing protein [Phascolomyces articulosus]